MIPQFSSPELNHLLNLELAEGVYRQPEDALIAGLKLLRESRKIQSQIAERLASLQDGRAIDLLGDEQLGEFLDAIDQEVDAELAGVLKRTRESLPNYAGGNRMENPRLGDTA